MAFLTTKRKMSVMKNESLRKGGEQPVVKIERAAIRRKPAVEKCLIAPNAAGFRTKRTAFVLML
ncbi:hypothetical protein [Collinsella provencensis]|uniref:hypothetical protein n=1 Tax=Collinsella provencensis TaxID=1937461 RepID=UPI000C832406|nr:hypothetical protein [Collinsella provencensis]